MAEAKSISSIYEDVIIPICCHSIVSSSTHKVRRTDTRLPYLVIDAYHLYHIIPLCIYL